MRGYAAFAVFICHFIIPTHPNAYMAYGGNNGANDYWIPQLPIFRLIYSGHICVSLFFVISGFSISLKPLKLARRGSHSALFDSMVSAAFRRPVRLYLPSLVTLVLTFMMGCLGALDFASALRKDWPFAGSIRRIPATHATISARFSDFATQVWNWADPLNRQPPHISYSVQLWTIPVELRCSFITFAALTGLVKTRPAVRMATIAALALYFKLRERPEPTLFLAGTILAELHLIRQERLAATAAATGPCADDAATETRSQKMKSSALFIFALFIASYPAHGAHKAFYWRPFYLFANLFVGDGRDAKMSFWTAIASPLLIWVVSRSAFLQTLFTTRYANYLGKVSFSLYCVHQVLINWFGYRNILFLWTLTGNNTPWSYELGIGLALFAQTIATIWAADVFWRFVDLPCVKFTRWIEKTCFVSS